MRPTVLVTAIIGEDDMGEALALLRQKAEVKVSRFGRAFTEDELLHELRNVDAVFAGGDPYTARVLETAHCLKIIARDGVGLDRVDLDVATRRGIVVTITPTICESVADLAFSLITCLFRRIMTADRLVKAGEWRSRERFVSKEVNGATLGIIGLGRIGGFVAKRAASFNMRVLAFDPYVTAARAESLGATLTDLKTLLSESDVVTVHAPLSKETRGLIGRRELSLMKKGAFLVNTARGAIVDEGALIEALTSGPLGGAGLDVLSVEPPSLDNPLLSMENVILTPHMGNDTHEAFRRLSLEAGKDIISVLEGEMPLHAVNPEALAQRRGSGAGSP